MIRLILVILLLLATGARAATYTVPMNEKAAVTVPGFWSSNSVATLTNLSDTSNALAQAAARVPYATNAAAAVTAGTATNLLGIVTGNIITNGQSSVHLNTPQFTGLVNFTSLTGGDGVNISAAVDQMTISSDLIVQSTVQADGFSAGVGQFIGNGGGLTNAVSIAAGTNIVIVTNSTRSYTIHGTATGASTTNFAGIVVTNTVSAGAFAGNGAGLTNLNPLVLAFAANRNTFLGTNSGNTTLTGEDNTAYGFGSLGHITSGNYNVSIGVQAMQVNTNGSYNVAIGDNALNGNLSGWQNVAIGYVAMGRNKVGDNNVAIGQTAMQFSTNGASDVAIGSLALNFCLSGQEDTAIGQSALYSLTSGNQNTAIGSYALENLTTAANCTAVGYDALRMTLGYGNMAFGAYAMYSNITGRVNCSVGMNSGDFITAGDFNTFIGVGANATVTNLTNATAIGANAKVTKSHQVMIGDDQVTETILRGAVRATNGFYGDGSNLTLSTNAVQYSQTGGAYSTNWTFGNLGSATAWLKGQFGAANTFTMTNGAVGINVNPISGYGLSVGGNFHYGGNAYFALPFEVLDGASSSYGMYVNSTTLGMIAFPNRITVETNGTSRVWGSLVVTNTITQGVGAGKLIIGIATLAAGCSDYAIADGAIGFGRNPDGNIVGGLGQYQDAGGYEQFYLSSYDDLVFISGAAGGYGTEKMRIKDSGFVGIGTNAPQSLLHVAGTITANATLLKAVASPPTVTGNDGAFWNSNKVVYWVTTGKTNLVSDGR